jgi:hypothetical protein
MEGGGEIEATIWKSDNFACVNTDWECLLDIYYISLLAP